MSTEVGSAYVTLLPSTKGFGTKTSSLLHGDLSKAGTVGGSTYGSQFGKTGSSKVKAFASGIKNLVGPALAIAGTAAAVSFFKGSFDQARESQKVGAQTAAVLKSTDKVAGISGKKIGDLANAISRKTGIDDEAIQSSENLLLTFTNVRDGVGKGNKIFDQATQTIQDMSVSLGQDGKSSAIQLGKALNDPVKGITALSRVGVSFTDQQKAQIAGFVKSGDTMKAQKVILGELTKEFGGSAAAAATPGDKAAVAFGNLQEVVGKALLPVLDKVLIFFTSTIVPAVLRFVTFVKTKIAPAVKDFAGKVVGIAQELKAKFGDKVATVIDNVKKAIGAIVTYLKTDLGPSLKDFVGFVGDTADKLKAKFGDKISAVVGKVKDAFGKLADAGKTAFDFLNNNKDIVAVFIGTLAALAGGFALVSGAIAVVTAVLAINPFTILIVAIAALVAGLVYAYKHSETFRNVVDNAFTVVKKAAATLVEGFKRVVGFVVQNWPKIQAVISGVFDGVVQIVKGGFKIISGVFKLVMSIIHGDWSGAWDAIKQIVSGAWTAIQGIVKVAGTLLKAGLKLVWEGLKIGVRLAWDAIKNLVAAGAGKLVDVVKSIPGKILDLGGAMLKAGKDFMGNLFDGIVNVAQNAGGFVSDLVGKIKDGINNALGLPLAIDFDKAFVHIHATLIPALAKGGIVSAPTIAMIGEGREPEAVLPLSKLNALIHDPDVSTSGRHGGGNTFHIDSVVAHDYQDFMLQAQRRTRALSAARG